MIDTAALIAAVDLSALIGSTVKLRRISAGRYVGRCPFHNEKTGSFWVYTDGEPHYHCYGCGAHGDAIRWLTDHDRLSFKDACADLARIAGVDSSKPSGPRPVAEPKDPRYPAPQHEPIIPWGGQARMIGAPVVLILHEFPGRQAWFRWREVAACLAGEPSADVIWWPTVWDGQAGGWKGPDTPPADRMHLAPIALQALLQPPARTRYEYERGRQLERLVARFRGYRIAARSHQRGVDRPPPVAMLTPNTGASAPARPAVQTQRDGHGVAA